MTHHNKRLSFSLTKPNVIVGPNGSGKSALIQTIALRSLSFFTGASAFDDGYVDTDEWWSRERPWGNDWKWLKDLSCITDNAPCLYYRPGHVPGNEVSITYAMMTGYFDEAKAYGRLVDKKSSGQQSRAVQLPIMEALTGSTPRTIGANNWRFGREPRTLAHGRYYFDAAYRAELLKSLFANASAGQPLVLMDEPEQSLDARGQAQLWSAISQSNCNQIQVIVATHSLYPLLHRDRFNIIEAEAGFVDDVLSLA